MKKIYRVIMNDFALLNSCLVNEDNLADFIYQHKHVPNMMIMDPLLNFFVVEKGEVVKVGQNNKKEVKERLNESIKSVKEADCSGSWKPLSLYLVTVEVIQIENFYVFATDREKAASDFAAWSIFDAIDIRSIA